MSTQHSTLAQIMCQPLLTLAGDASVSHARERARRAGVHHFPVLEGSTLVGLVCTCDMHDALPDSLVSQCMSYPPVTLDVSASTIDAAHVMLEREVGSVIVTFEDQPQGIVTRGDLLLAEPSIEDILINCRCEVCGLTRHLTTDDVGRTFCMFCKTPAGDEAAARAPSMQPGLPLILDKHPLASLIREHQLIGPLAEALASFAACIKSETGSYDRGDLDGFVRVFRDFADCVHHEKEEAVLLPFLSRCGFDWSQGTLAEVRHDHRQERYLIEVLYQAAAREEAWNHEERRRIVATATALADFQREHLNKENTELFPAVTERLNAADLQRLETELRTFDANVARYMPHAELETLARRLIRRYLSVTLPEPDVSSELGFSVAFD